MTNDRRQQDFAERLSRISKERGQPIGAPKDSKGRDIADFDYDAPRGRHPIRNALIWVIILAGAGTGGYYGWGALPQDLKDMAAGLFTSDPEGEDGELSPEEIAETDTMSDQGPVWASPAVVQRDGTTLDLAQIASGVSLPTEDTGIGDVIPIVRNAQCDLRQPLTSETLMGVRIENALLPAPLYAFSNAQLAQRLMENVEAITQDGADLAGDLSLTGEKAVLDVFVTETSAPVYLVLQNMGPGIVWNLQTAADVNIAHVALIGSDFSGVANLPEGTTVEALLVSDYLPPHQYGADDTPRDCMIRPWRSPQPDWIGSLKSEAGSLSYQNQMYSYTKGFEAYNRWFTETLGTGADTNTVTARDAAHVLLGPVPDTPVVYRSLAAADLHMMETDHLLTGDATTRQAAAIGLHERILTAAVGGSLGALNPDAVERNSQ